MMQHEDQAPDRGKINFMDFSRRYLQESDALSHYPFASTKQEVLISGRFGYKIVDSAFIRPSSQRKQKIKIKNAGENQIQANKPERSRTASFDGTSEENVRKVSASQKNLVDYSRLFMNGSTFDAAHLSSFLQNSRFVSHFGESVHSSSNHSDRIQKYNAPKPKTSNSSKNEASSVISERARSLHNPSEDLRNQSSISKSNQVGSSFFRSAPRPESLKEMFKQKDFPGNYTSVNILVTGEVPGADLPLRSVFEQRFKQPEKTFDQSKVNLSSSDLKKVQTPAERLSELLEVKKNQQAYRAWQDVVRDQNKQYRVLKGGYKSGVLNVDNPLNSQSVLYKEESSKLLERQRRREKNASLQKEIIRKAFENHHSFRDMPPESFEIQKEKIVPYWTGKSRVPDYSLYSNSKDRLFGSADAKRFSLERIENIRRCELGGRDYNILSWAENKIAIPTQAGVKIV